MAQKGLFSNDDDEEVCWHSWYLNSPTNERHECEEVSGFTSTLPDFLELLMTN